MRIQEEIKGATDNYAMQFELPNEIPSNLLSDPVIFKPVLTKNGEAQDTPVQIECTLDGDPVDPNKYFKMTPLRAPNEFELQRLKFYAKGDLIVKCYVPAAESPTGEEISMSINLSLRGIE